MPFLQQLCGWTLTSWRFFIFISQIHKPRLGKGSLLPTDQRDDRSGAGGPLTALWFKSPPLSPSRLHCPSCCTTLVLLEFQTVSLRFFPSWPGDSQSLNPFTESRLPASSICLCFLQHDTLIGTNLPSSWTLFEMHFARPTGLLFYVGWGWLATHIIFRGAKACSIPLVQKRLNCLSPKFAIDLVIKVRIAFPEVSQMQYSLSLKFIDFYFIFQAMNSMAQHS